MRRSWRRVGWQYRRGAATGPSRDGACAVESFAAGAYEPRDAAPDRQRRRARNRRRCRPSPSRRSAPGRARCGRRPRLRRRGLRFARCGGAPRPPSERARRPASARASSAFTCICRPLRRPGCCQLTLPYSMSRRAPRRRRRCRLMNYVKTAMLLALLTAIFVALGAADRRPDGHGDRLRHRARHELVQPIGTPTRWCCACTARTRSTSAPRPSTTASCASWRSAPACRCRASTSCTARSPTRSPPGAIPSHAAVCASTGLLQALSREELAGVIAHELAHIKNHDTLTMTIAATIGGAISMLAQYMQFGMLFGGNRDDRSGVGMHRRAARDPRRALRRHARADGDQPLARIFRRPRAAP